MKIRVRAFVEKTSLGGYVVKCTDGATSPFYADYQSAQRHADYINNEDSDCPRYMEVADYTDDNADKSDEYESRKVAYEKKMKKLEERREKELKRVEDNRKSKRSDDKYVFVISMVVRGEGNTAYFKGETDLAKIGSRWDNGFMSSKDKDAKVFKTKASAQRVVDNLSNCWFINKLIRNIRVVRKAKDKIDA